jgi:ATP-dependent helicase/nuclease subunit A
MRLPHDLSLRALSAPGQQLALDYEPERLLTDEQEQAVARRRGSLLLAAGAGSGKTSVLVERFVRAVREDGVAPGRILAITFTERAAGELRERVRARLLKLGERDAARDAEAANVCTFHGFCARLLRIHPLQAGVEPGFQILEEGFAERLRVLSFGEALAGFLDGSRPEAVDLVAAYGADPLRLMVLGTYAQLRSQGQAKPRLPLASSGAAEPDELALRACELIDELLDRFGSAYAQRKSARATLDFDDLELSARALLEQRTDIRDAWAKRFELLMVDEFQDSSPRQLQVLAALDRDNLFTVGDEQQSIYGFRHADVGLFRERHAQLSERGATLALTRNFRSAPEILMAVERIFAERMGNGFTPLTAAREEQGAPLPAGTGPVGDPHIPAGDPRIPGDPQIAIDLKASVRDPHITAGPPHRMSAEPAVELLLCDKRGWERLPGDEDLQGMREATPWRQAEARLLAWRIAELVATGQAQAGEVVVLLRALGDVPVYESALRRHGLPTLAGVGGFWGHQQVGDLLAWLRSLANPLDELALHSTLASPLVGLSSDALALLATVARERKHGVWRLVSDSTSELDTLLPSADRARLASFRELFLAERAAVALRPISELLRRAIVATGYEAHVLSLSWGERRLANVRKLVRLARRFEAQEGRDLRRFLDHIAHLQSAAGAREADAPVGDGEVDSVRLMSIHAAKGLEFPVVCVADLGRDPNLRSPDLLVDRSGARIGLRLLDLATPEPSCALAYDELREERRAAQQEEEDRVLYVACTRAERRLILSGSVAFGRWPAPKPGVAPIAWLAPALVPDAPALAASEQRPTDAVTIDMGGGLRVRCLFSASTDAAHSDPDRAHGPGGAVGAHSPDIGVSVGSGLVEQNREPGVGGVLAAGNGEPGEGGLSASGNAPAEGGGTACAPYRVSAPYRPAPLSNSDTTMSYTSLAELERCGYRYYLERILRLPENRAAARAGGDGGVEARIRGTIVHVLLESIDFAHPQPPSAQDVAAVSRRIGASLGVPEREEIVALLAAALAADPARRLARARRPRREHPFAFSLAPGQPLVTGVLDLIVELPDGAALIVDYKSDRLRGEEDLELLVRRDYSIQRLLYALAAIEDGVQQVEVAHWFLDRPGTWVAARFDYDERDHLRELLLSRVESARSKDFRVTESPHRGICLTCPGRGGLCSWGEDRTMAERSC